MVSEKDDTKLAWMKDVFLYRLGRFWELKFENHEESGEDVLLGGKLADIVAYIALSCDSESMFFFFFEFFKRI